MGNFKDGRQAVRAVYEGRRPPKSGPVNVSRQTLLKMIRHDMWAAKRLDAADVCGDSKTPLSKPVGLYPVEARILTRHWVEVIREAKTEFCQHCQIMEVQVSACVPDRIRKFLESNLISFDQLRQIIAEVRANQLPVF